MGRGGDKSRAGYCVGRRKGSNESERVMRKSRAREGKKGNTREGEYGEKLDAPTSP